jgi:hemerythrin-like domain-containing protein
MVRMVGNQCFRMAPRFGANRDRSLALAQTNVTKVRARWLSHSHAAMEHASLTVIRREHRALSAMLRSIVLLLDQHRRRHTLPDFAALRAMLFYVDEFPERLHHPKESRLLFPKLRGHDAATDALLDRLDREHAQGEHAIRDLEHALTGFEMMAETDECDRRRQVFEQAVTRYVGHYLEHMKTEEEHVLPLAETVLSAGDWSELDAAFAANRDPLAGAEPSAAYRPLYLKILHALPAMGGVGGALEALAGSGPPRYPGPHA